MAEQYTGVKFKTVFKSRALVRDPRILDMINWAKEFSKMGFAHDKAGNVSFRTDNGFVITSTGSDLSNLTKEDFTEVTKVDLVKKEIHVNGIKEPSSESFFHNEIYRLRKDINSIFHGHNEDFLKFGVKLGFPITEKEQPGGTIELVKEISSVLGNNTFLLIKNHGFLSLGDSVGAAGNLAVKRYTQLQRVKNIG
ncbi:MAG: class II aldolase/adducin family protein [Nanoarchaeota archaeon]|nr:class II aldolase/adducin family protein [Nanoarchaeota archaeon]MBU1005493.1 class II aldolase/adducin family protein [Nanoarchaeota archaeon]MBU1946837.1 class II aldolase/adducin family protein [Nanoarchaeota archaeon]